MSEQFQKIENMVIGLSYRSRELNSAYKHFPSIAILSGLFKEHEED